MLILLLLYPILIFLVTMINDIPIVYDFINLKYFIFNIFKIKIEMEKRKWHLKMTNYFSDSNIIITYNYCENVFLIYF